MDERLKAMMADAEDLHTAYEENKSFYKAGYNYAIEEAALEVAKKINYPTEACAVIRSLKK